MFFIQSPNLNTDGSFEYLPNANFNGTDTFTYQANDGTDDSNIATVTIIVNDVPIGAEPPVFGSLGDETLDASVTPGFDGVDDLAFSGAGNDFIDTESGEGGNRVYGQSGDDTFTSRGDKPVKTLIERGFQPWRSLYKLSKTRGLIENKQ